MLLKFGWPSAQTAVVQVEVNDQDIKKAADVVKAKVVEVKDNVRERLHERTATKVTPEPVAAVPEGQPYDSNAH